MKFDSKILITFAILLYSFTGFGQKETYLQPFSSLLVLNPTFAGRNGNTHFNTGNQYYYISEEKAYNLFYATYDKPLENNQGAIGVSLLHGTIGQYNTSTSELAFSYSGFEQKFESGSIMFSASTGILLASKQWFNYFLDNFLIKEGEEASPPGKKFSHYYLVKPGLGFLANFNSITLGLSGNFPLSFNISHSGEKGYQETEEVPLNVSFYLAKKEGGNRYGLKSSPFESYPELIVFYNKEFILSRASFKINHTDRTYGVFVQSDFTNSIHSVGGTIGYRFNNTNLNISTGVGIPGISDKLGVTCEFSVNIIIPPVYYSKINPWVPQKK